MDSELDIPAGVRVVSGAVATLTGLVTTGTSRAREELVCPLESVPSTTAVLTTCPPSKPIRERADDTPSLGAASVEHQHGAIKWPRFGPSKLLVLT